MTRAHRLVLVVTLACGALVGPQAQAADVVTFQCRAVFNLAAPSGVSECRGTATGTISSYIGATFSYSRLVCPVIGVASGTIGFNQTNPSGPFGNYAFFDYTSVGGIVVFTLTGNHGGAGVGVLIPDLDDVIANTGLTCSDTSIGMTLVGAFVAI